MYKRQLLPTPKGPPIQPVLISQTLALHFSNLEISISAYTLGCNGIKGAPKQAEKFETGSLIPTSVPANLDV